MRTLVTMRVVNFISFRRCHLCIHHNPCTASTELPSSAAVAIHNLLPSLRNGWTISPYYPDHAGRGVHDCGPANETRPQYGSTIGDH
jgi:hypothetical protein